jgi:Dolichyl-phosphate-mannose-protein mannosyltransferase
VRARLPFYLAVLIAGATIGITLRYSAYVPLAVDTSAYVSGGARWLQRDLQKPVHVHLLPRFPAPLEAGSPLGYRPGAIKGTDVVEYPAGLPMFIAAGMALMGEGGAYVVGPLFVGLLAFSTYRVGAALAGEWAGVLAAILISASPVTIRQTLTVNSDVPAAACWTLAWLMSLSTSRGAAAAAGAATTAAVMVRPNTAPLAIIVGTLVLLGGIHARRSPRHWRWGHAAIFAAVASLGAAIVLWSNAVQYGGPFEPGYKGAADFFAAAHVIPNLKRYPAWLLETHSAVAFLGLVAVPGVLWRAPSARVAPARIVTFSALAFVVLNYAIYLPYLHFEHWAYLRFMLPALTALFVLLAATLVWLASWLARRSRWLALLILVPLAVVIGRGAALNREALREWKGTDSVLLMGNYLRSALPPDAVVLCYLHCGPARYYTGRPVVRLDAIQPQLDAVIAQLQRARYRPVLVLDDLVESPRLPYFFPASPYNRLDWPPRAVFWTAGRISYFDPADRTLHAQGGTYPVDVLR